MHNNLLYYDLHSVNVSMHLKKYEKLQRITTKSSRMINNVKHFPLILLQHLDKLFHSVHLRTTE